jgi:hypothetical protein
VAERLQKDSKKNFSETFGHGWSDPVGGTNPLVTRGDFVLEQPKLAIFESVTRIAMHVVTEASKIDTEMALEGLRAASSERSETN